MVRAVLLLLSDRGHRVGFAGSGRQQLSCSGASLIACANEEWKPVGLAFLFFAAQESAATSL